MLHMNNRLAVYCFYDRDGIVDDYVLYFLKELRRTASRICCVVNGKLCESGRKALEGSADEVLCRENEGLDAGAFAFFVNSHSEEIRKYDELIFCNNSFFGPLYPLENVFCEMDGRKRKNDFWGMTIHPRYECVIHKSQKLGYVNEHVQSYFMVFTRQVSNSPVFLNFFRELPPIHSFYEAVCLFELELTRVLSEAGFSYGSLSDHEGFPQPNSTILYPDILIREKKFPFIKRKVFIEDYGAFFSSGRIHNAESCLQYVRESTSYDEGLIWQHILRTAKMSVLRQNLNLNFVLGTSSSTKLINPYIKTAVVCYISAPSDAKECIRFASNAAGMADLYFVSGKEEVLDAAMKCAACLSLPADRFILKPGRGGDVSAWLIACKPLFCSYDYICFVRGPADLRLHDSILSYDCFRMCIESMLFSKSYVANVLNTFETHPELGLAVMPPLRFGPFYGENFFVSPGTRDYLRYLMSALKLYVPFDDDPVAPCGGMFWCRTAALRKVFCRNWTYDELPQEPLPPDGTILHALEKILPFAAQASGYCSAWIQPDVAAASIQNNLYYIDRKVSGKLFQTYGTSGLRPLLRNIGRISKDLDNVKKAAQGKIRYAWDGFRYGRRRRAVLRQFGKEHERFIEFLSGRNDLWDPDYYLGENPDIAGKGLSPLDHYLTAGWKESRSPSGSLVTDAYLRVNPDCRLLDVSPLVHYYIYSRKRKVFCSYEELRGYLIEHGAEILKNSSVFDPDYYTKCCSKKHGFLPEGFNPYSFYLEHGAYESVRPSAGFGVHRYFERFPDIRTYGICPLVHYELIGRYL